MLLYLIIVLIVVALLVSSVSNHKLTLWDVLIIIVIVLVLIHFGELNHDISHVLKGINK